MDVYCFEPSLVHFENLLRLRRAFEPALEEQQARWHLVNAAVGSHVHLVRFPRACLTELCTVSNNSQVRKVSCAPHVYLLFPYLGGKPAWV